MGGLLTFAVRRPGGLKQLATTVPPVQAPPTGTGPTITSLAVPDATVTTSSATINLTFDRNGWWDIYYATDAAALAAFTPTASGQDAPAGVTHRTGNSYGTAKAIDLGQLAANTTVYYRIVVHGPGGPSDLTVDVVRNFKTKVDAGGGVPSDPGDPEDPGPITGVGPKLKWRPPTTTVDFQVHAGVNMLPAGKVARLIWPDTPIDASRGVTLDGSNGSLGFHSVGGEVKLSKWYYTQGAPKPQGDEYRNRPLVLTGFTNANCYVEGFYGHGKVTDGIDTDSNHTGNTFTFANILIGGPTEPSSGENGNPGIGSNHSDCFQAWSGPKILRIDGFTGYIGYQGINMSPRQHLKGDAAADGRCDLRNVQLIGVDQSSRYFIWFNNGGPSTVTVENCWYKQTPGKNSPPSQLFWDQKGGPGRFSVFKPGTNTTILRTPSNSGRNYVSPGYL